MEAPVARVSSPVRNSRHRDSAPVQPCDQPLGSTLVIERLIMGCSLILNLVLTYIPMISKGRNEETKSFEMDTKISVSQPEVGPKVGD